MDELFTIRYFSMHLEIDRMNAYDFNVLCVINKSVHPFCFILSNSTLLLLWQTLIKLELDYKKSRSNQIRLWVQSYKFE